MVVTYDPSNIFARILRGEIPCKKVLETEHALAFHDINPKAPIHILVLPKGSYVNFHDFNTRASTAEIVGFYKATSEVITAQDQSLPDAGGYRIISNCGVNGGQEVEHFHVHILGGGPLGPMISRK